MSTETGTRPELVDYLARVRAALADLPGDELAEVMEDVEPHVIEVFDEAGTGEEVVRRLGTPEAYAAELRAAGGYPPPFTDVLTPARRTWSARYAFWMTGFTTAVAFVTGLANFGGGGGAKFAPLIGFAILLAPALWSIFTGAVRRADIEALPEYRFALRKGRGLVAVLPEPVLAYFRSLRPAWWLVRVLLVAVAVLAARSSSAVPVLLVAVLVSWAGPRSRTDRRFLPVSVVANAFLTGVVLALVATVLFGASSSARGDYGYYPGPPVGLTHDGDYLSNVYAVDGDGKAIPEFYLYDENGNPLNVRVDTCGDGRYREPLYRNRFPLPEVDYRDGRCVESTGLPFVPLPPNPSGGRAPSATSPTTAPSITTTPSVTATPSAPTTAPTTTAPTTTAPTTTAPPTTTG
ncbi:hypothetical protein [Actinokineospora sp. NBRC 105648]|uniref:DUF1700 domain-containing protein n=1 Tax=Actinokineospora sp. NBRC 105648 TaxID=3032206 RepID=UPI0024A530EC|nr:hypothetical protein [Actinokineospora sp. NBRC 105648]GLZ42980.1 hypothetical protein Acsp05_66040 [Actinokineospora sp. NBRC 105648]